MLKLIFVSVAAATCSATVAAAPINQPPPYLSLVVNVSSAGDFTYRSEGELLKVEDIHDFSERMIFKYGEAVPYYVFSYDSVPFNKISQVFQILASVGYSNTRFFIIYDSNLRMQEIFFGKGRPVPRGIGEAGSADSFK